MTKMIFAMISLISAGMVFNWHQSMALKLNEIRNIESGINTCFARVQQSFTSKMIGVKTQNYLSEAFLKDTEECFSEAVALSETNEVGVSQDVFKKVTQVSVENHWLTEVIGPRSVDQKLVAPKFEKVEAAKFGAVKVINEENKRISALLTNLRLLISGLIASGVLLVLWYSIGLRKKNLLNKNHEREAEVELSGIHLNSDRVEHILNRVLEDNELKNCSYLYDKYAKDNRKIREQYKDTDKLLSLIQTENIQKIKNLEVDSMDEEGHGKVMAIVGQDSRIIEIKSELPKAPSVSFTDVVKNENNFVSEIDDSSQSIGVHLDRTIGQNIGVHSANMFKLGIKFDLKGADDILVKGNEEDIDQIFFQILNFSVKQYEQYGAQDKKIIIKTTIDQEQVQVDININGILLDGKWLGVGSAHLVTEDLPVELNIINSLLKENNGRLVLSNSQNSSHIKVYMTRALAKRDIQVVSVKKGTKKELLRNMSH